MIYESRTVIIIDSSNVAHASFHAMGELTHLDNPTGVLYGFLNKISYLSKYHKTLDFIFCFDRRPYLREEIYPEYKVKDHKYTREEERAARKILFAQLKELRRRILKSIGFRNIFWQEGYEADDIIAAIILNRNPKDKLTEYIIVSSDKDLYQLLDFSLQIKIMKSGKQGLFHYGDFIGMFGVTPDQWSEVKAIAGCYTDGVEGVKGVGEITASKYINGILKKESVACQNINSKKGQRIIKRNRKLVHLPYKGTEVPVLRPNRVTTEKWNGVCEEFGMKSLIELGIYQRRSR